MPLSDAPKVSHVLVRAAREIKNPHAPVLLNDFYVCECGALASDPVTLIVAGECDRVLKALNALDHLAFEDEKPKIEPRGENPTVESRSEWAPGGLVVRIRAGAPKQVWRGASVGENWGKIPPHYETVTGFYAEAELDATHVIVTNRHETPLMAFAALQSQLTLALQSNVIRFEDDGRIVPL